MTTELIATPPRVTRDRAVGAAMSRLDYFAPFCYSPRGPSQSAERSRCLRTLIKQAHPGALDRCLQRLRTMIDLGVTPAFLSIPSLALVPLPRRTPTGRLGASAPAVLIGQRLLEAGVGAVLWPALGRIRPLAKSAWAHPGTRPEFHEHYDSLALVECDPPSRQVLLVDDVVTRGRTLLSAAMRLRDALPQIEVYAFALLRTDGLSPDIEQITAPLCGTIRLLGGDAFRRP